MQDESRQSARKRKHGSHAQNGAGNDGDEKQRDLQLDERATDSDGNQGEQRGESEPGENAGLTGPVSRAQGKENEHEAGYAQDSGFGETTQGSSNEDVSSQADLAVAPKQGGSTSSRPGEGHGEMLQPQIPLGRPGESGFGQRNDERGSEHIGGGQQRNGAFEYGGPGSQQGDGSRAELPNDPDVDEGQRDQGAQVGKRHSKVRPRKAT